MSKLKNVWVITDNTESIAYLTTAADALGEETTLVFAGDASAASGANKAYAVGAGGSFAEYIPAIVALIKASAPGLVLTDTGSNGRLAAGIIAASMNAALLTDVTELSTEGGITGTRMVYGGTAFKTEKSAAPCTVVCLGQGVFQPRELPACADVTALDAAPGGVKFIEKQVCESKGVNLTAAKKVVAVGRGVPSEQVLADIRGLADAIEAEMGCTRPIAEEEKWMPKESYIGVSGVMLKPDFYLGIGLSGQIQHMVGINQAGIVAAINKDKNAPIFQQCDYGLVADITEVLDRLKDRLK
mgnify:FL=1